MVKGRDGQQRRRTRPARQRRPVPAQPRWPADHAAGRRLGIRPAEDQPRGDRRVPDRDQHVRHHAGPIDRDAGAGDLRARAPTTCAASTYGFFRSDSFNAADPVANKVLPFENQQVGVTLGGPVIQNRMHFFGVLRIRAAARRRRFLRRRGSRTRPSQFETKPINKNYLGRRRLSAVVHGQLHRSAGSVGRSTTRSRSASGTRASVDGGTAQAVVLDQRLRHLDARREHQPDDAGARRLQPLLLVQRCDSVERRAVPQHAVLRAGVPVSRPDHRRRSRTTRTTPGRTPTAAGWM